MHGLEQTTLEAMDMLMKKKIPFVVALNKIDRIYEWKPAKFRPYQDSLKAQEKSVQMEFEERVNLTKLAFAEKGHNVELYNRNEDEINYIDMVFFFFPLFSFSFSSLLLLLLFLLPLFTLPPRSPPLLSLERVFLICF